jgi:hypothetical protein
MQYDVCMTMWNFAARLAGKHISLLQKLILPCPAHLSTGPFNQVHNLHAKLTLPVTEAERFFPPATMAWTNLPHVSSHCLPS